MAKFFRGASVTQVVKPITGTVVGFSIDQEKGERLINVEYTAADGSRLEKFFSEDELELVPNPADSQSAD